MAETINSRTLQNYVSSFGLGTPPALVGSDLTLADIGSISGESHVGLYGGGVTGTVAMAAAKGLVVFPEGETLLSTMTIAVPMYFLPGAYLTVPTGQSLTITSRVTSSRQWIFRGDGNVYLNIVNPDGEDSKNAHISWWGVFPRGISTEILTAKINKAFSAYSLQNREGCMEFDNGSYRIDGKITIPRGIWLKGAGSRRTIFDLIGQGYTALEAGGDAVRITGIQFEQPAGTESQRSGTLIDFLDFNNPVADDIWVWGTDIGIKYQGNDARITNIFGRYNYGVAPGAGSALVWVAGGSRGIVDGVAVSGQLYGPEALVLIGSGNVGSINQTIVNNVINTENVVSVKIMANVGDVNLTTIENVSSSGGVLPAVIDIVTSGSANIRGIIMSGAIGNSQATNLLRLVQGSSGATRQVSLSDSFLYGSGTGISITRTAGTLSDITLGDTVNIQERSPMVAVTGTVTNLQKPAWMV